MCAETVFGDVETEAMKGRAWKTSAKGHPTRWRTLRDAVAILSLRWMDVSEFQVKMRRLWVLKNNTSREILEELEQGGSVKLEKDPYGDYKWGATREGVAFWLRAVDRVPATIVQVALTTWNVRESEA